MLNIASGGVVVEWGVVSSPKTPDHCPPSHQIYDLVMAQSGLFLGGGDQARIMTAWRRGDGTGESV